VGGGVVRCQWEAMSPLKGRIACTCRAVTLSNENALSRFRACLHPYPAGSDRLAATHGRPVEGVTMASAGIRRTPTGRYRVWWRLDDASEGSQSFDTRDQARDFKHDLLARLARGSWVDPRLGTQSFETWASEWWDVWSTDPDRSPATLQATEGRLRRYLLPFFGQHQLRAITVSMVRRWQNELRRLVGHDTVMACRSVLNRILQAAEDDRRIDANPVRKVSPTRYPPTRLAADACSSACGSTGCRSTAGGKAATAASPPATPRSRRTRGPFNYDPRTLPRSPTRSSAT